MSGGHFNYDENRIQRIAEELRREIPVISVRGYSEETNAAITETLVTLEKAYAMVKALDYLLSGDNGEESFHKDLSDKLSEIEPPPVISKCAEYAYVISSDSDYCYFRGRSCFDHLISGDTEKEANDSLVNFFSNEIGYDCNDRIKADCISAVRAFLRDDKNDAHINVARVEITRYFK